jgi:formate hydrogenlyase subunit 4
MHYESIVPPLLGIALAPLLVGIINRTKAVFAGRHGQPFLQVYYDLRKLFAKGAVYSRTTTWVFRAGPIVGLSALLMALLIVPFGSCVAPLRFQGDLILFVYLLGLARFFVVMAALDTGSAFEGMGASREVLYSALAEPALLLGLAAVARQANVIRNTLTLSLSGMHEAITTAYWGSSWLVFVLVAVALFVVFLAENSRVPVDDPNTHLELTMIHEVMVLDHGGPDFGLILYGQAIKLWVLGSLIIGVVLPLDTRWAVLDVVISLLAMLGLAVLVGVVESTMARLRLVRVPQLLVGAATLSGVALVLECGGKLWISP